MNRSLRRFRPLLSLIATALGLSSSAIASFATVGATTPFTSYEAEAGTLGGGASVVSLSASPTSQYSSPQLEASGHAYVLLKGSGQSVSWTNNTGQNVSFVNLRYCIPDAPTGGGITATLDLYVDGVFRQAINMNSRQTWQYEGNNHYSNPTQNPSDGDPINFWDDASAFVSGAAVAPGSTITLQVDSSNTASFYDIDVIDVENPPAPIAQPANSLSITDYGAVADNNPTNGAADPGAPDSSAAIQNCVNVAEAQGKIVWIPQGTFYVNGTNGIQATGVTIEGAGMWYSKIYRNVPLPNSTPLGALFQVTSCHVSNFACDSDSMSRNMVDAGGGAMDTTGTNWTADSIWTEHVESGFWASGTSGTISNCRLLSIFADGANINNVSMGNSVGNNITEKNNFVRGTGDDGIAINSVANNGTTTYSPMQNCTFVNNTVIAPWGGKCIAVYGGSGHLVQNNYASDTARYIGLGAGRFGVNGSDLTGATITGNMIVRCGGNGYNQGQPAMHIGNAGDGQSTGVVSNVTATGNTIVNAVFDAMGFSTGTNIDYESNTIQSPWRNGVVVQPPFTSSVSGSATIKNNAVNGLATGPLPFINHASAYTVTQSGNNWQQVAYGGAPYGGTASVIPGTIQFENYDASGFAVSYFDSDTVNSGGQYRTDGVDIETCSDTGGGYDVGWTNSGEWLNYTINAAYPGGYNVSFRVASGAAAGSTAGSFHLIDVNGNTLATVNVLGTGGWQTWTTVNATVTLPAGLQVIEIYEDTGGYNLNWMSFGAVEAPYGGTPWPIPGTIQSENYDTGGEGLAYHETDATNNGGQYRPSEGVDVENCVDTGGGYDVGWNYGGEWQNYTVNVSTAGTYAVTFRVANGTTGNGSFHLQSEGGANLSGSVVVPPTGGWQTWTNVTANITLPAGQQILTVYDDAGGYNINYMTFAQVAIPAAPTGLTATASSGQIALAWSPSSGASSYNVYSGTAVAGEGSTPIATGVMSTSYTNTGLTNGTNYYYTVAAVNAAGVSGPSNEVNATPLAVTGYNVWGIDSPGTVSHNGGFDNKGNTLDSTQVGSSVTWNGQTFTFGPVNAVDGWSKTTVNCSATGSTLSILGAAVNGNQTSQTFTVLYTDGSTSSFTQNMSDWHTPQSYSGESKVITMADRLTSTGATDSRTFYIYGYSFPLTSGKTIRSVVLPSNRNVVVIGVGVH